MTAVFRHVSQHLIYTYTHTHTHDLDVSSFAFSLLSVIYATYPTADRIQMSVKVGEKYCRCQSLGLMCVCVCEKLELHVVTCEGL